MRLPARLLKALAFSGLLAWTGASHAQTPAPDQPMTFRSLGGQSGDVIIASGTITPDTSAAFVNFAEQQALPAGAVVWLHSEGGDLESGLALGRAFRSHAIATRIAQGGPDREVAGRCISACALAFLGGAQRSLQPGSVYGVHQLSMDCTDRGRALSSFPWLPLPGARYCPDFGVGLSAIQAAQGEVAAYVSEMGAAPELVAIMSEIAPNDIRELGLDELNDLGVLQAQE